MDYYVKNARQFREFDVPIPQEQCAILLGKNSGKALVVERYVSVPNMHPDPANHFRIDGAEIQYVASQTKGIYHGLHIVGFLHTHWRGSPDPSYHDVVQAPPLFISIVYHIPTHRLTLFDRTGFISSMEAS